MSDTFAVSVIIPVYNHARLLREALQSVREQSLAAHEIIVVDDGSTDAPETVVAGFSGVRLMRQTNAGIAAARNTGVRAATHNLLAFLDADDIWTATRLESGVRAFRADPNLDMVFGAVEQFVDESAAGRLGIPAGMEVAPGTLAGTMLISRQAFARVGPFDERLRAGEFIDWYDRARTAGLREARIETVLLRRRIHSENTGVREPHSRMHLVRMVKAHRDRQQAASFGKAP